VLALADVWLGLQAIQGGHAANVYHRWLGYALGDHLPGADVDEAAARTESARQVTNGGRPVIDPHPSKDLQNLLFEIEGHNLTIALSRCEAIGPSSIAPSEGSGIARVRVAVVVSNCPSRHRAQDDCSANVVFLDLA